MVPALSVVEYTDPACPWAWGSEPTFRWLRLALGEQASWRRVFGILFDDIDDPAPDPEAETAWYARHLADISKHTSAPYPRRLRWVARTSWPASVVAKVAEEQGPVVAERVLRRLRETTFVLGTPADTIEAALAAVQGIAGLDVDRLATAAHASRARALVRADWEEIRNPPPEIVELDGPPPHSGRAKLVHDRYRFALPTLGFRGPSGEATVPGWRDLSEYVDAVRRAAPEVDLRLPRLSADEALARFRSLTAEDLRLLTGANEPPGDGVRIDTGNGPLWLHSAGAEVFPTFPIGN